MKRERERTCPYIFKNIFRDIFLFSPSSSAAYFSTSTQKIVVEKKKREKKRKKRGGNNQSWVIEETFLQHFKRKLTNQIFPSFFSFFSFFLSNPLLQFISSYILSSFHFLREQMNWGEGEKEKVSERERESD